MTAEQIRQNPLKKIVGDLSAPDAVDRIEALAQMTPEQIGILSGRAISLALTGDVAEIPRRMFGSSRILVDAGR